METPKQILFDPQDAINKAEKDLLEALDKPTEKQQADATADAVGRLVWIKKHETEPPKSAIPTAEDIIQWHNKRLIEAVNKSSAEGVKFLHKYRWGGAVAGIIARQRAWLKAREEGNTPPHPLAAMIRMWQEVATAEKITKEVDKSFPIALRIPFGAVSAEELEAEKDYHLPGFEPFDAQMMLNLDDTRANQLAPHLPIRSWLADWNTPGAKPRGGRGGAVPLWLRLFLEALVCADRFHLKRVVYYELEYLYKLMFGDKTRWDIVRARRLRQMIDVASRAAVVLPDGGEEVPVNFKYFEGLEKDSKVFVEIAAVRDTRGGALTGIDDLRDAYRSSNATLQAYLSATEYLDRVWTHNNRLRYDTIPARNHDGVILDHQGNPITKKIKKADKETGKKIVVEKPIKSLKGAGKELLAQMKRIPNPKFTPDPIDVGELVSVCWADNSIPKSQRRSYKKRALDTWKGLGIIDLEKGQDLEEYQDLVNVQDLVIIRPSQEHRKAYRAIKKASEQAKNQ